ncbi:MAG TPA: TA system VapC family ribonuclease toxin [Fibrobacteria bacterium]|nr:TA system VapC family ribonuclease toxin [Fibrobacteria bacterium]
MIALDTNILVYAHREDSPFHARAREVVGGLAEGSSAWALPWPVAHEFLAIVTHPRVYAPPSPIAAAFGFLESLAESPTLRWIGEGPTHLSALKELALTGKIAGGMIHDARIAALCRAHGIKELWSADRDFSRMKGLRTRNPLTG